MTVYSLCVTVNIAVTVYSLCVTVNIAVTVYSLCVTVNTVVTFYSLCVAAYIKRVIAHPNFRNIGYKECEKAMANMDLGDVIIRPSSKVKQQ